ncbi:SpoIIE family protein phosphatase [Microbacterium mcarthurae (nom. nud.)]|uniref:SpoIIE family protein phosphatase n=1 Tax=Microbacterium mcarthurae TaxID=3035918 RepID=A0ABW9GE14_9MICO
MTTTPSSGVPAVEDSGLWDSPPDERFDRITRVAQELFDVDLALVNVVGADDIYTKGQPDGARFGFSSVAEVFCGDTVQQDDILEIEDARAIERYASRGAVTHYGMRFYAGIPLRNDRGDAVATLCLLDGDSRHLDAAEREALYRLGQWAQAEARQAQPGAEAGGAASAAPRGDSLVGDELRLAALAIPHGLISGDRSGWQQFGGRVVVTLADVMGKGEEAGRLADELLAALQSRRDSAPLDAVRSVEDEARATGRYRDTFATLFHTVIDTTTGIVDFVDAGHGLTLLLRADGTSERLRSHNLPLGLRPRELAWEAGQVEVARGDLIVSVSDGALDAYDSTLDSLRLIGEDLRRSADPDDFFRDLSVRVSTQPVDDDVTAVVVSIH